MLLIYGERKRPTLNSRATHIGKYMEGGINKLKEIRINKGHWWPVIAKFFPHCHSCQTDNENKRNGCTHGRQGGGRPYEQHCCIAKDDSSQDTWLSCGRLPRFLCRCLFIHMLYIDLITMSLSEHDRIQEEVGDMEFATLSLRNAWRTVWEVLLWRRAR